MRNFEQDGECFMAIQTPTAAEMRNDWILDGPAELTVRGEHELEILAIGPMALWCPQVYKGTVAVEFDCTVPDGGTKLLLLLHGHGSDGTPVSGWERDGSYDGYNAGRMELYSLAFNRGSHISDRLGDQLANVRRIGGPQFAIYTAENFRKHGQQSQAFWNEWNVKSLLGAGLEPDQGLNKRLHHRMSIDPPTLQMAVNGTPFTQVVDHRAEPLRKGSIGFRCMSRGKRFVLENVRIETLDG